MKNKERQHEKQKASKKENIMNETKSKQARRITRKKNRNKSRKE